MDSSPIVHGAMMPTSIAGCPGAVDEAHLGLVSFVLQNGGAGPCEWPTMRAPSQHNQSTHLA